MEPDTGAKTADEETDTAGVVGAAAAVAVAVAVVVTPGTRPAVDTGTIVNRALAMLAMSDSGMPVRGRPAVDAAVASA